MALGVSITRDRSLSACAMLLTSGLQRATQPSRPCYLLPLRAAVECADMVLQHAAVVLIAESLVTKRLMGFCCGVLAHSARWNATPASPL